MDCMMIDLIVVIAGALVSGLFSLLGFYLSYLGIREESLKSSLICGLFGVYMACFCFSGIYLVAWNLGKC